MSRLGSKQRWSVAIGGLLLTLLLAAVFTFGSLDVPFEPKSWRTLMPLYAVSSFVTAALLIFLLILGRTILRLWAESSREQLGARFKSKMVVGAMAISLLPIIFMFIVSYSLINRTLLKWFPRPLEIVSEKTQEIINDVGRTQIPRLRRLALQVQQDPSRADSDKLQHAFASGADAVWILDRNGDPMRGGVVCDNQSEERKPPICASLASLESRCGHSPRVLKSGKPPAKITLPSASLSRRATKSADTPSRPIAPVRTS